jgi:hypothetical protein
MRPENTSFLYLKRKLIYNLVELQYIAWLQQLYRFFLHKSLEQADKHYTCETHIGWFYHTNPLHKRSAHRLRLSLFLNEMNSIKASVTNA